MEKGRMQPGSRRLGNQNFCAAQKPHKWGRETGEGVIDARRRQETIGSFFPDFCAMKWFRPRIVLPGFVLIVSGVASCCCCGGGVAPESVALGSGCTEISGPRQAAVVTAEARFAPVFFDLKPWIGGFLTITDDAWFLGAGIVRTLEKNDLPWFVGAGIGAGYYERGEGKDLGSHFEVLSFVECGYRFADNIRLTLRLSHISNASTASINPGTEMLTLGCTVPLGRK